MESNSSFITFLVYDEVACVSSQISPMGNLRLSPQMNHIWVEINSEVAFVNFFHEIAIDKVFYKSTTFKSDLG